jgi:hypothetical protein
MRVIVCGGRDYGNAQELYSELDKFHEEHDIRELAHGAQRGADTLAGKWAKERNIPVKPYPADWDNLGDAAGPKRNMFMLTDFDPDAVIAFHGGTGTLNMVKIARRANKAIYWLPEV